MKQTNDEMGTGHPGAIILAQTHCRPIGEAAVKTLWRLCWAIIASFGLAACGPAVDPATLPPLPDIDVTRYQSAVRQQIEEAVARVNARPGSAAANGQLGMIYRVYRDLEAAEVLLRRARLLSPRDVDWMYYHGETLVQLGRNEPALAAMLAVIEREPNDVPARLHAARLRLSLGDVSQALPMLFALVDEHPQVGGAQVSFAQALARDRQFERAAGVLEAALERFGSFASGHYELAQIYRRLGEPERARAQLWQFEVATTKAPRPYDPRLERLFAMNRSDRAVVRAAQAVKRQGDAARALELLERAIQLNPENQETRAALVVGYAARSDFERAQVHAQAGLAIEPRHAELGFSIGRLRLRQGQIDEAIDIFRDVSERSPRHVASRVWLGRALERRGRSSEAGRVLREAVAIDPRHQGARRALVAWLLAHEQDEVAIDELSALSVSPTLDAPHVLSALAGLQAKTGAVPEALTSLERGIELARQQDQLELVSRLSNQRAQLSATAP